MIQDDVRELVRVGVLRRKKIGEYDVILLDRMRDREILESVANHLKGVGGRKQ